MEAMAANVDPLPLLEASHHPIDHLRILSGTVVAGICEPYHRLEGLNREVLPHAMF
jgi:hypothetical protein